MNTHYGNRSFVLPPTVIEELRAEGFVRSISKITITESVDVVDVVLVVYNTAAASTVTLFQAPGVIRALAHSLRNWFRRERSVSDKFELTARGPHGNFTFSRDQVPDMDSLIDFLSKNVWGDE